MTSNFTVILCPRLLPPFALALVDECWNNLEQYCTINIRYAGGREGGGAGRGGVRYLPVAEFEAAAVDLLGDNIGKKDKLLHKLLS